MPSGGEAITDFSRHNLFTAMNILRLMQKMRFEEAFKGSIDSALKRTGRRERGGYREIAKSRETFAFNPGGSELLLVIVVGYTLPAKPANPCTVSLAHHQNKTPESLKPMSVPDLRNEKGFTHATSDRTHLGGSLMTRRQKPLRYSYRSVI